MDKEVIMRMQKRAMTRGSPFRRLENEMNRFFEPAGWMLTPFDDEESLASDWRPAVDVSERKHEYRVRTDLPGVDSRDIDVTLEDGVLTVKGERAEERREDDEGMHRVERFSGTFFRRLALPDAAEDGEVTARFNKGVLEVSVPKDKTRKARRIEIQS
jgi:HSP20 family protein